MYNIDITFSVRNSTLKRTIFVFILVEFSVFNCQKKVIDRYVRKKASRFWIDLTTINWVTAIVSDPNTGRDPITGCEVYRVFFFKKKTMVCYFEK